jgi:hypothetical protein
MEHLAWDYPLYGLSRHTQRPGGYWLIWGKCLLWGDVWEHEMGYRAQHARVGDLVYVEGLGKLTKDQVESVAKFYGVNLVCLPAETSTILESAYSERVVAQLDGFGSLLHQMGSDVKAIADLLYQSSFELGVSVARAAELFADLGRAFRTKAEEEDEDG